MGTVILRLRARDRDVGQNARIIYEFSQHTAEQYGHLFGIKAESGKIYIKNNLDFEVRFCTDFLIFYFPSFSFCVDAFYFF